MLFFAGWGSGADAANSWVPMPLAPPVQPQPQQPTFTSQVSTCPCVTPQRSAHDQPPPLLQHLSHRAIVLQATPAEVRAELRASCMAEQPDFNRIQDAVQQAEGLGMMDEVHSPPRPNCMARGSSQCSGVSHSTGCSV